MKVTTVAFAGAALVLSATGAAAATTTFSNGAEGWTGPALVDTNVGLPAPAFHSALENFGVNWTNSTNADFTGNYAAAPSVTISLDVLTNAINFNGNAVTRGLFVYLTDVNTANPSRDASVVYRLGTLDAAVRGWQHYSVTIADTSATALPTGWSAIDGDGNLSLPSGRSFTSVLRNVDRIMFSTYQPDYVYGFTVFNIAGDNFTVDRATAAVPEPASWSLMLLGFGLAGAAVRRRRRAGAFA